MDQKDEKPRQHQLLGGSDVPTTAKRFSTTHQMCSSTFDAGKPPARFDERDVETKLWFIN